MISSTSEFVDCCGARIHVRRWGNPAAPTLFMLHGWMDVSASFQFVVDELKQDWNIVAPDWRGFGQSEWLGRSYLFADYLADLDLLLDHYAPTGKARLLGHSMGGIVACLFAGVRPERVQGVVNIEGFGIAQTTPEMAPLRYRQWLASCRQRPSMHRYPDRAAFVSRLMRDDPYLSEARAHFLSLHLALDVSGGLEWNADPWHKAPGSQLFRLEESMAVWRCVQAPVLWVVGTESKILHEFDKYPDDLDARKSCFSDLQEIPVEQAGHMLHHDQPAVIATLAEQFFAGSR